MKMAAPRSKTEREESLEKLSRLYCTGRGRYLGEVRAKYPTI